MDILPTTRIIDLTLGQFEEWMKSKGFVPKDNDKKPWLVYGIRGIMDLLHVSETTAHRMKKTVIAPAVSQQGRKIITDADMAIELYKSYKSQKK